MFSVIILTLNEEQDLPHCLASLHECDDVVVLDSGSIDRTVSIAEAAGARVVANPFKNFGQQRTFAQHQIPFLHPWVFHLDADETMTPELRQECLEAAQRDDPQIDGYWVAPKMMFQGRWIPHCTDFPAYQARYVRAPSFQFIQVGHGQREAPDMRLAHLKHNYLHDLSSDGDAGWLAKHRRYAESEAAQHSEINQAVRWPQLFDRAALARRRALKRFSFQLPFRPTARFIYQYFLRRGFLDGAPGLHYCRLLRQYEQFVDAAMRRRRQNSA